MRTRLKLARVAPQAQQTMRVLQDYVNNTGLEKSLLELVKLRASYIKGCAYCVDMHAKDAREFGEMAIISINAWNRLAVPFRSEVGSYKPVAHV